MVDHFLRCQRESRANLTLALLGRGTWRSRENVHLQSVGIVTEAEKLAAIARAPAALVMPSRHESLSMAVLESWMMGRPVLVNGDCEVLRGQVLRANGGLYYRRYEEFAAALDILRGGAGAGRRPRPAGTGLLRGNYSWDVVLGKYEALLARSRPPAGARGRP